MSAGAQDSQTVAAGWAIFGTVLALALGGRVMDPADVEARAAAARQFQRCQDPREAFMSRSR